MKINFSDSFDDSIKTLIRRNTWWYKTYEFFRYDLPRFFKNIWRFRKALWNHYWYDHHGTLMFLEIGLSHISDNTEKYGIEVDKSRLKKVEKMRRVVQLIKNYNEDLYIEMAEKELGEIIMKKPEFKPTEQNPDFFELVDNETPEEKEHNLKVYSRATELEESEWNELCEILKGQDYNKFNKETDFDQQFDGSGLRGWWD